MDLNFSIDKEIFSDSIKDILRIKHFYKLKEFVICLYRNNLYLNTRSYKWDNEKSNLCSNCNKLETQIHIFQACSTMKDLLDFLERILTSVGNLKAGNAKFLFLYEGYKANYIGTLLLIFLMRYTYNSKFNSVPVNKNTFAYAYRQFNLVMVEMNQTRLKKAPEILTLLNKELGI